MELNLTPQLARLVQWNAMFACHTRMHARDIDQKESAAMIHHIAEALHLQDRLAGAIAQSNVDEIEDSALALQSAWTRVSGGDNVLPLRGPFPAVIQAGLAQGVSIVEEIRLIAMGQAKAQQQLHKGAAAPAP